MGTLRARPRRRRARALARRRRACGSPTARCSRRASAGRRSSASTPRGTRSPATSSRRCDEARARGARLVDRRAAPTCATCSGRTRRASGGRRGAARRADAACALRRRARARLPRPARRHGVAVRALPRQVGGAPVSPRHRRQASSSPAAAAHSPDVEADVMGDLAVRRGVPARATSCAKGARSRPGRTSASRSPSCAPALRTVLVISTADHLPRARRIARFWGLDDARTRYFACDRDLPPDSDVRRVRSAADEDERVAELLRTFGELAGRSNSSRGAEMHAGSFDAANAGASTATFCTVPAGSISSDTIALPLPTVPARSSIFVAALDRRQVALDDARDLGVGQADP